MQKLCKDQFDFKNQKDFKWLNKHLFEKCFSDICDFISLITFLKKTYFAIFVDQITKWLEIHLLHTKNNIIQIIKNFIIFEKKKFNQFVKRFHADNAKKFIANTLKNYYVQKNINSTYSAFYIFQQTDAAKRIHWILINKIRIMLTQSKLPRKYWDEAVLIANYFYNRILHSTINFITSFEIKFGKTPDLNNVYVWRSPIWKKFPNITKLTPQIEKHYLIGYYFNQWKLLNLFNERTCWTRDIWVVESPAETYENLTEELSFSSDEKSIPLLGTLPGQITKNSETSFITNSLPLFGQIDEEGIDIDSVENSDFMNIKNPKTFFENFMKQVFETAFIIENPVIYKQIISAENALLWKKTMKKNLTDYKKLNIWNLVNLPLEKKIINGRWTYFTKPNPMDNKRI